MNTTNIAIVYLVCLYVCMYAYIHILYYTCNISSFLQESHTIHHFQYTTWPDHGIPQASDGILRMLELARKSQGRHTAPVLVHCRFWFLSLSGYKLNVMSDCR